MLDGDSPLWRPARSLLDAALRLEQNNATYSWHGWNKQQITTFLDRLSPRCSLVVGVWAPVPVESALPGREAIAYVIVRQVFIDTDPLIRSLLIVTSHGHNR